MTAETFALPSPDIPNSDNESFNPSLWEEQRKQRAQVAFECDEDKDERETPPRVSARPSRLNPALLGGGSAERAEALTLRSGERLHCVRAPL